MTVHYVRHGTAGYENPAPSRLNFIPGLRRAVRGDYLKAAAAKSCFSPLRFFRIETEGKNCFINRHG
jgi:hypothetical protein